MQKYYVQYMSEEGPVKITSNYLMNILEDIKDIKQAGMTIIKTNAQRR